MREFIEILDCGILELISQDSKLEIISTGFLLTEGPVWNSKENCLYFSDIPGNTIYQYSDRKGIEIYRKPSHFSNGLTLSREFQIIACEHQRRAISIQRGKNLEILCDHYQNKRLNSPNDVIIAKDGSIIFTDPIYGLRDGQGGPAIRELPFQGVYRLPPGEKQPILICNNFERPNGLALNSSENCLYVDDTVRQHIRIFHIGNNWDITGGEVFIELIGKGVGRPDGMKLDIHDNIFCTGSGGIWVFNPSGKLLGKIQMPEKTANIAWGDEDRHSLFICSNTSLYRLRLQTLGKSPNDL